MGDGSKDPPYGETSMGGGSSDPLYGNRHA